MWNAVRTPYSQEYIDKFYRHTDARGRWMSDVLERSRSMGERPNLAYEFNGYTPRWGWRVQREKLEALDRENRIAWSRHGKPRLKRYLHEQKGLPPVDVVTDIPPLAPHAKERLGYPTQKPVTLLERIVTASSRPGDVVLDPFCGCGTSIHAAQQLDRHWIGIDICVEACRVIEERLRSHFDSLWNEIEFIGIPKTRDDARVLAGLDAFRFERWAASLVRGVGYNEKQRGDGGIDGWGRLAIQRGRFVDLVSQVKGGSTGPGDVQAFNGARQQVGADLGIFTCFEDRVTTGMRDAAASAGRFMDAPRVQIYTVDDYFEGRVPRLPLAA